MLSLLHLSPPGPEATVAAEQELPIREGARSPSVGLQFISGDHPSAQLLFPCRSGKAAFSLGRGTRLPHPSPCLSLEKTKPLLYLRKYKEMGKKSFDERKTTVPPTTKSRYFKKGEKKGGPQCHLLLRPSALSGMLMTHPL